MGSILSSRKKILSRLKSQAPNKEKSLVTEISKNDDWNAHLTKEPSRLTLVDFSASWCPPSNYLEPLLDTLASKYPHISFIKIDVETLPSVAEEFKINAMPTLVVLKQGKEVKRTVGAKKDDIEKMIDEVSKASQPAATN